MIGNITGPISTTLNNTQVAKPEEMVPINTAKEAIEKPKTVQNSEEATNKHTGRKSSPEECETCKHRKYQDGSDEMVSFKSASHVSPEQAVTAVRAHEQEHVSNAYSKAEQKDGKVISATVSIHTAVCPECGRTYVSGGTTDTKIMYHTGNNTNGYQKAQNFAAENQLNGSRVNASV